MAVIELPSKYDTKPIDSRHRSKRIEIRESEFDEDVKNCIMGRVANLSEKATY
jgi:hypothetical protein